MANYNYNDTFAGKDALPTGSPAKVIKASEFDSEFNAIETAVNSKADSNNAALTGTTTLQSASFSGTISDLGTVTTADINGGAIDGVTIGGTTPAAGSFTTVNASGDITGNLVGNVTGDVTGNITGDVTGDVTGNLTGTVLTAAQPNITSVGTLTNFTSTGIDDNASSTALTIDASGRAGIGTTPGALVGGLVGANQKFVVDGTIGQVQIAQTGNEIAFSRNSTNYISATESSANLKYVAGNAHIFDNNGSESMRIASNGRLGISQPNPDSELHIGDGTSLTEEIILEPSSTGQGRLTFKKTSGSSPQIIYDQNLNLLYINLGLFSPIIIDASTGNIIMENLPTSSTGLSTGTLWNDGGTVKVA